MYGWLGIKDHLFIYPNFCMVDWALRTSYLPIPVFCVVDWALRTSYLPIPIFCMVDWALKTSYLPIPIFCMVDWALRTSYLPIPIFCMVDWALRTSYLPIPIFCVFGWALTYFLYGWLGIKDQLSIHSYLCVKDQLFVHVCLSEAFVIGGCLCFRFDASDLPLLLSIAGTHTPNLALGSEAKVRSPFPWPVILTTALAQQMAPHVCFPFDQNRYKQLKWYLSFYAAVAVVHSI